MNKARLLKLADLLESVPRKSFTIDRWESSAALKPEGKKLGECGFAGCAVGWATHVKLFRGLTWGRFGMLGRTLYYQGHDGWSAVAVLFDLYSLDSIYLFGGESYVVNPTPNQVAKRIRKFVEVGHQ